MPLTPSFAAIFIFSFAVGFGAVVSPGPLSAAIVSEAPRRGWSVGPLLAAGHSFLELVLVVLLALGLGTLLGVPQIKLLIAIGGGALLIWMGGGMLWSIRQGKIRLPQKSAVFEAMGNRQLLSLGMLTTISNPFWYAWWVTVAAGYLAQAQAIGPGQIAAFYLGHITADFTWDTLLSTVVGGGRRWMNDRLYQGVIGVCGMFFVYLGWVFISQGAFGQ